MGTQVSISVELPGELVTQAGSMAQAQRRSLDGLVTAAVDRYIRNGQEYEPTVTKWRQETLDQGVRSEEDMQALLDGTLTLEDLKHRG